MGTRAPEIGLARPTYVPAVDGLRGIAVIWIAVMHCWSSLGKTMPIDGGPLQWLLASGYFGLDLLFIVSGFVLFLPMAINGKTDAAREYLSRRAARIVPGFWAATVLSYVAVQRTSDESIGLLEWVSHLTFTHQYVHAPGEVGFGMNRAMWTMSVEVAFYLLLPIVASRFNRRPFAILALTTIAVEVWHQLTLSLPSVLAWFGATWEGAGAAQARMAYVFPSYAAHFAVGMAAAWLYVRLRNIRLTPSLVSAVAAGAMIAISALALLRGRQRIRGELGALDPRVRTLDRTFLFGILVLAVALMAPRVRSILSTPLCRALGRWSYGIYLSHMILIALLMPILGLEQGTKSNFDLLLLVGAVLPLAVLTGAASYQYLEMPFRRMARRPKTDGRPREPVRPVALAGARG